MALTNASYTLPRIQQLPETMPSDGAISIALEEGVPVFRAAKDVEERILDLLDKQKSRALTADEQQELDRYEEIDDYLSHLNRLVRNMLRSSREK